MKPYIDVNNETQRIEMDKWNGKKLKLDIIETIDQYDEAKLQQVYDFIKTIA